MRRIIIPALMIAVILVFCGCSDGAKPNQDILKIGDETGDWGFPSPYGMYARGPGYIRMSLLFDTLIWKDSQGQFVGMLAESWSYDQQNNSFIFHLRPKISWHDGEPFTADDVLFTFNYMQQHPWVWVDFSFIESVEKLDDLSFTISLSKPYAPFLANIAGTLPILPQHIWQDVQEPLTYRQDDALVGTGPYRLADYNPSEGSYLYEANQNYYGGKVSPSSIAFIKVSQETTGPMLESGAIDAGSIPADIALNMEQKGFKLEQEPPVWAVKLIINHQTNILLAGQSLRQALAYGINLDQLVEISQRGQAEKGSPGLIPPANTDWHNPQTFEYEFNPSLAESMIEELGYGKGQDGYYDKEGQQLELELAVSQGNLERDAQIIKSNLEDIGIKIDLVSYEAKTLDSKIETWDFDLALSGHGGLGGDPESLNRVVIGKDFNSVRYFKDQQLVDLLNMQIQEMDQDKRKEIIDDIQEIYARQLPSITLYYPQWYWAHNGKADIFFTPGGLATGIPIPINKKAFIGG